MATTTAGWAGSATGTYSYMPRLPGLDPKLATAVSPAAAAGGAGGSPTMPAAAASAVAAASAIRTVVRRRRTAASSRASPGWSGQCGTVPAVLPWVAATQLRQPGWGRLGPGPAPGGP